MTVLIKYNIVGNFWYKKINISKISNGIGVVGIMRRTMGPK